MKKFYFLTMLLSVLLIFVSMNSSAQEMIVGGDMEDEGDWEISFLNQDSDNDVTIDFGYTDDKPQYGEEGCLHVYGTNTGTTGGNLTNVMFYQQLTLTRGVEYAFNGAYKDKRTNNYWTEVYVGGNEPAEGADYGGDQGAVFVSGFKSTNWEGACPSDEFDGTFAEDACIANTTNIVFFEGEGDTTVYFGFRMGIWDGDGNNYDFEVWIDNISLMGSDNTAVKTLSADDIAVYPTQVTDYVNVQIKSNINNIQLVNAAGQKVREFKQIDAKSVRIDMNSLNRGLYHVVVIDENGFKGNAKVVKM
ncbi:MAG: T9SS type A sorting domain-containing protein [Prolixibacteraceae bacterium]|nr:T9SS type A sorting domain-containing protein [Prolixibacteraceae bacterium]